MQHIGHVPRCAVLLYCCAVLLYCCTNCCWAILDVPSSRNSANQCVSYSPVLVTADVGECCRPPPQKNIRLPLILLFSFFFFKFAARAGLLHQTSRLINNYRQWRAGFFSVLDSSSTLAGSADDDTLALEGGAGQSGSAYPVKAEGEEDRAGKGTTTADAAFNTVNSGKKKKQNKTQKHIHLFSPFLLSLFSSLLPGNVILYPIQMEQAKGLQTAPSCGQNNCFINRCYN